MNEILKKIKEINNDKLRTILFFISTKLIIGERKLSKKDLNYIKLASKNKKEYETSIEFLNQLLKLI